MRIIGNNRCFALLPHPFSVYSNHEAVEGKTMLDKYLL